VFADQLVAPEQENVVRLSPWRKIVVPAAAAALVLISALLYSLVFAPSSERLGVDPNPIAGNDSTDSAPQSNEVLAALDKYPALSELSETLTSAYATGPVGKRFRMFSVPANSLRIHEDPFLAEPQLQTAGPNDGNTTRSVYEKAAPSTVYLLSPSGSASGFIVDKGGWILTNYHVAVHGELGADQQVALNVVTGTLKDNFMQVAHENIQAKVYKWDKDKDLALLRVKMNSRESQQVEELSPIALRTPDDLMKPLDDVYLIGNSAAGFLWSIKPGKVSQVATFGDIAMVQEQILRLTASSRNTGDSKESAQEKIAKLTHEILGRQSKVKVIEASAPCARGDSGGPLLDENGRLSGVCSFAIQLPGDSAARFYYLHHLEVADFLRDRPSEPLRLDLLDVSTITQYSDAVSFELRSAGQSLAVVGTDQDGDIALVALYEDSQALPPAVLAGLLSENGFTAEMVLKEANPDFLWFSKISAQQFGAAYNTDADPGLDVLRWDRDYDGKADLVLTRGAAPRAPIQEEESLVLDARARSLSYEFVFRVVENATEYLQRFGQE